MAVRFDASGDLLSRTTSLPPITTFTIMAWCYISVDRNAYSSFFSFGRGPGSNYHVLSTDLDGVTLLSYNGSTVTNGSVLPVGSWFHLALAVAGTGAGQHLAYLNGVLDITKSGYANPTAETLWVGNSHFDEWLSGRIAAYKLYAVALTVNEIKAEMRQYVPVRTADLNTWSPLLSSGDVGNYGANAAAWTVSGTLATEDGPPIPWTVRKKRGTFIPAPVAPAAGIGYKTLLGVGR